MTPPHFRRRFAWLLALLVGITALALLVGGLALHVVEAELIASAGDTLALAAADIADKLDRILFERYSDIQILAETPLLQGGHAEATTKYLAAVQMANPVYAWIAVVDEHGRVTASTDSSGIGQGRSGEPWFRAVRGGAPIHVQDAGPSPDAGGGMVVTFTAPLRGAAGAFRGAVTAQAGLPVLEDVFARPAHMLELQRGGTSKIEWQFLNQNGEVILDSILRQQGMVNLKQMGLPSMMLSLAGASGYIEETHLRRKVPVLTGYAKTGGYGRFTGLQWTVLVRLDRSDILAPIRALLWKLGLAGAVLWAPLFGLLLWSLWRLRREWVRAQASDATLRETENRFQSAFEETSVGMVLFDLDGRFLRVNPAFCTLVGYAADELSAKTFRDITHPDDLAENLRLVAQLQAGETPAIRLEKRYRHKRGQTIWVQVSASLVRDARNVPRYYIAQSQDITERKQAEERLRQSEERFRTLVESAPLCIHEIDLNGRLISMNRAGLLMMGAEQEAQILGLAYLDVIAPEDRERIGTLLARAFAGETSEFEFFALTDQGPRRFASCFVPIKGADGSALKLMGMTQDITERKQAEERLRQSEEQFRKTFDEAPIGMATVGTDYRFTRVNRVLCDMLGYTQHELTGKTFLDITHPEDRELGLDMVKRLYAGDISSFNLEKRYLRKDRDIVLAHITVTSIRSQDSRHLYNLAMVEDITERKRAAERQSAQVAVSLALAESVTLDEAAPRVLQSVCDTMDWELGMIWSVDEESDLLRFETLWRSPALKADEFVALSRATTFPSGVGLPGRVWTSGEPAWISDVVQDPNFPRAPAAAQSGLHGAFGFPVKSRGKVLGVIEFFSREIRQPDNSLLAMMADVGLKIGAFLERSLAEAAARANEERFQLAIDSASDAILYLDRDHRVGWANEQLSVITGRPLANLLGSSLMEAFAKQPLAKAQLACIGLGRSVPPVIEFEAFLADGTVRWLEVTVTHLRKGEEFVGWLLVARDRTERRQIERQLRQSEKMASLGLLLDGVAHELNNPLFMISGFAQLAEEKMKTGAYTDLSADLSSIREASHRASEILQRTVMVARHTKAGDETCQVNTVVQKALGSVKNDLAGDKIAVRATYQPDLAPVLANPQDLRQVFLNLITNAARAMRTAHGQGVLTVTTALVPNHPKPWVELRIADDGPGIASDLQARIFEPFSTAQQGSRGTGLSLAICHRILTDLGGTLTVESHTDHGAVFIARLPAMEVAKP